jgi:hypothetical protein
VARKIERKKMLVSGKERKEERIEERKEQPLI